MNSLDKSYIPSGRADRKLRLAYTPNWHAHHGSVTKRYEDMIDANG